MSDIHMENYLNQFECKEVKAGEVIYDTKLFGSVLLFATKGAVLIHPKTGAEINMLAKTIYLLESCQKEAKAKLN